MSLEFLSLERIQELSHQYGYWAVAIGIALENMGIPLPGETITIVGGFLAGSGDLNYWLVLGSAIFGAFMGSNFGYWVGEIAGWAFLLKAGRFLGIQEQQMEAAKNKFGQNASKAVFFGRFILLLRIFVGPLAGITKMPYLQFLLYNLGGATLWASVMVTLSFFFGRLIPLEQLVNKFAQFGILALLIVIAWLVIPFWYESRKLKQELEK
ncbi:MAG: DedA family protein [Hydrococcus sp. Prado102]|nr:DedA family protein [Hydrococcus sp. Prado102]